MATIGVRQLKNEATRVIRSVREQHTEYVVTVNGEPVAVLRPYTPEDAERQRREEVQAWLARADELTRRISKVWPPGVTAAEAVAEQRREL